MNKIINLQYLYNIFIFLIKCSNNQPQKDIFLIAYINGLVKAPFKKYSSQLNLLFIPGLVQQSDKIVVRYAHTIYPYSLDKHLFNEFAPAKVFRARCLEAFNKANN